MRYVATAASARAPPITMVTPAELWSMYEAAAESESLLTDILTSSTINTMSDTFAQATERTPLVAARQAASGGPDVARTGRFALFGAADGAVSHAWFIALDQIVGEDGTVTQTLLKVLADQLVYTPLFCVWFLAAFVILEGRDARSIPRVLRERWFELFRGNFSFFLPLTGLIYGYVPRDERVLAFGLGSLVYTWILSLWNSARSEQLAIAEDAELCRLADDDCAPLPAAPPRTRAFLSVGIRRAVVSARRSVRQR